MKHWTEAMRTTWRTMQDWPSQEIIEFGRHCLMEFGQGNPTARYLEEDRALADLKGDIAKRVVQKTDAMMTQEVEFQVIWHLHGNPDMTYFIWARDPETAVQETKRRWSILSDGYATVRRVYR